VPTNYESIISKSFHVHEQPEQYQFYVSISHQPGGIQQVTK